MTVAGGERAFSKLKLINYLRSTMSQDRLCSLAMLSIESQLARKLNFKDLISELARLSAGLLVSKAEQGPVITVKWHSFGYGITTHDAHRLRTRQITRYISK